MHLFLYQAARHVTSAYNRRRLVQGTIRGDFDLELLYRCIKGRFKIMPHGDHEIQPALKKLGLEEELYGHIVAIEDHRNAVWFKLNYDMVGKNTTKYIGGWRDLDAKDLVTMIQRYEVLSSHLAYISTQVSNIRYQSSTVNNFIASRTPHHDVLASSLTLGTNYLASLQEASEQLKDLKEDTLRQIKEVQDEARAYLAERRL